MTENRFIEKFNSKSDSELEGMAIDTKSFVSTPDIRLSRYLKTEIIVRQLLIKSRKKALSSFLLVSFKRYTQNIE